MRAHELRDDSITANSDLQDATTLIIQNSIMLCFSAYIYMAGHSERTAFFARTQSCALLCVLIMATKKINLMLLNFL